ncbi:MAG: hypothetical protein K8Q88_00410 [Nitrosarchaeum sp.]|nr:hypothetical protein [Nitrosarchaeum sp.]
MVSNSWYVLQSTHNKETSDDLNQLVQNKHLDWEITTLFYSALHIINEYFLQRGIPLPDKHDQRTPLVRNTLNQIYPEYQKLLILSIRTRYLVNYNSIKPKERQDALDCFNIISSHIRSII